MLHSLRGLVTLSLSLLALSSCAAAQDDYLNHLVFTNSPTPDNDFYTGARSVAPSTLVSSDGRLPVETHTFFTPPNALSLQWRSVDGGSWDAEIRVVSYDNRAADFRGDTLSFWCYSDDRIAAADLPQVQLTDDEHNFTARLPLAEFAGDLPAGQWKRVQDPAATVHNRIDPSFQCARTPLRLLRSGQRRQHAAYRSSLTKCASTTSLLLRPPKLPRFPCPTILHAEAFERHVDLKWESKDFDQLAYTVIYRSMDEGPFEAVGIQQPGLHRYADFVGGLERTGDL